MEYHQLNCIRERATVGDTGDRGGGAGSRNLSAAVETVELWKQGMGWALYLRPLTTAFI